MSKATETKNTAAAKGVQVSATISPELHAALDEYQWTARKKFTEVIKEALAFYADAKGLLKAEDSPEKA